MGLLTDEIFFEALKADSAFMQAIGNRLYGTTIPVPDDNLDNVPVPYCIITYDGMNNQDTTKDDPYEGGMDVVNIGIELTAKTRKELGQLANQVRRIIHDPFAWVKRYAELRGYEKQVKLCPLEKVSSRAAVKELLKQLEALNPNVRDSIYGAMENIKSDYLPRKVFESLTNH